MKYWWHESCAILPWDRLFHFWWLKALVWQINRVLESLLYTFIYMYFMHRLNIRHIIIYFVYWLCKALQGLPKSRCSPQQLPKIATLRVFLNPKLAVLQLSLSKPPKLVLDWHYSRLVCIISLLQIWKLKRLILWTISISRIFPNSPFSLQNFASLCDFWGSSVVSSLSHPK